MTVGFQVFNEAGELQVDDTAFNFYLYSSGSGSTVSRGTVGNTLPSKFTVTVPKSLVKPIVAVRCSSTIALLHRSGDSTNWYFTYGCSATAGSATVYYYIFQSFEAYTPPTFGLNVYNAAGELTFSASIARPMRIVGVLSSSTGTLTATGKTLAVANSKPISNRNTSGAEWFLDNTGEAYAEPDYGLGPDWWVHEQLDYKYWGASISGSTASAGSVSFDDVIVEAQALDPDTWDLTWRPILVIDVTNY